ncbi:MAG TPA: hypothetical protein VKL99_01870 [Candidatus Angelobacter sp.]|nr:hypothetical protein [Candidatus Angelobacter sp.]
MPLIKLAGQFSRMLLFPPQQLGPLGFLRKLVYSYSFVMQAKPPAYSGMKLRLPDICA